MKNIVGIVVLSVGLLLVSIGNIMQQESIRDLEERVEQLERMQDGSNR